MLDANLAACQYEMVTVVDNGMKDMLVPIDQAGRIVLPKRVREDLAVKSGDLFKVGIHGTFVTLTPSKESAGFVRRGKALVFTTLGNELLSLETVNAALEEGARIGCPPRRVTVESSHVSSATSGTSDWRKKTVFFGSRPHARKSSATSSVFWRRSAGSNSDVME